MKDRVPLYPGRVKLTPVSGQENTYDMVRADEPTQEGTPLNKATFLKDATAALYGLTNTAVPDDVLTVLSRFHKGLGNEYVWSKNEIVQVPTGDTNSNPGQSTDLDNLYYADTFTVSDDKFLLENAILFTYNGSNLDTLKGKYLISGGSTSTQMRYIPETATLTYHSGKYFDASQCIIYQNPRMENDLKVVGYVNSPDPNAYPPSVSDGYTYMALGQLGNSVQIATGSYVGTGIYLASLTFDFTPKIVIIAGGREDYNVGAFPYVWGDTVLRLQYANYSKRCTVTINGNQMSWINSENNVDFALNYSGIKYRYIAIG